MRLSAQWDDAGFNLWEALRQVGTVPKVYLNDQLQERVITADDELGYIKRYVGATDGSITIQEGEALTVEERGVVRIEL
jgi:hypothetical protein